MHIIVLENYPSSQRGGQERSLIDVTRQLAQRGHRITLLHANPGNLLPQYEAFCDRIIAVQGFEISGRKWQSPLWFIRDLWNVWNTLKRDTTSEEPTIVYINQPYDAPFAVALSWIKNVPIVCHLRLPSPVRLGIQRHLTLPFIRQFIAVSEATRQGWLPRVNAPISVVYNGVNPDRFRRTTSCEELRKTWNIPEKDRVICYVGRVDQMKGIATLIQSFAQLLDTHPDTQLLIAGQPLQAEASYVSELEQLCDQFDIRDRVRFLGHIDETLEIFQLSDLAVVPSQWAEPCARSIIESMMAGTPVVASQVGGNPELLSDKFESGLFIARDVNHLAATLANHLNWRSQDSSLGDRYQTYAQQRFNLDDKLNAIEEILLNVAPHTRMEGEHDAAPQH
jgi:glycosyltransferase involved in cell wall biosynthesis